MNKKIVTYINDLFSPYQGEMSRSDRGVKKAPAILMFISLIVIILFTGCRNMPEEYVYTGRISGTTVLVGAIDGNYSGVTVDMYSTIIATKSVLTASSGTFAFTDLPDGTYSLHCEKNGYTSANVTGIVIEYSSQWSQTFYLNPANSPPEPPID